VALKNLYTSFNVTRLTVQIFDSSPPGFQELDNENNLKTLLFIFLFWVNIILYTQREIYAAMNIYQAFFSLKKGVTDMEFQRKLQTYMEYLTGQGHLHKWRLLRRKLGLGPKELGDWHLIMEFENLAALDLAFGHVATRTGEVERRHHDVNKMIESITFALYRDFPDPMRSEGGELF